MGSRHMSGCLPIQTGKLSNMKVYDCFIFNDELDMLEVRLNFLNDVVDHFVIVEAERTLSGANKPLYYQLNKHLFSKFHPKIIHVITPANDLPAWEYEFHQRNYIKKGLEQCSNDDVIFISDADEIINIKDVLSFSGLQLPALIELPMYYYFVNVKTNACFFVNLAGTWSFLKDKDLGFRFQDYPKLTNNRIAASMVHTGWHFSYLFGYDISKYHEKIVSFSHQEYNTPYFLDKGRIQRCIHLMIDLFERPFMKLSIEDKEIQPILPYITGTKLADLIYEPSFKKYLSPKNILFILHKKYYRRVKYKLQQLFFKKTRLATEP